MANTNPLTTGFILCISYMSQPNTTSPFATATSDYSSQSHGTGLLSQPRTSSTNSPQISSP
ncbi:hypothetical protein ACTXT7_016492 [Hymenolepis weldensis]